MNTAVSVIIPVYNTEKYLRECLDSIVNQTLKNIEVICVNDGSTDNSLSILEEYKKKDNRIFFINQDNKGAGAARNAGLDIAKGEFLAILDSDDIYDITMLEKMYNRTVELQTDITVCLAEYFDNATKKSWDITWSAIEIQKDVFSYKDTLEIQQKFDFFIAWSWDKLFRKSFVDSYGLRFQEISHSNDSLFVTLAMYAARRISILKESLVKHRLNREGSIELTHDNDPLCFHEMHKAIEIGLNKIGVFPEVKERFAIWVLRHSLWILSVIKTPKPFTEIYSLLQNNIVPENLINKLPFEAFDEKWLYDEMGKVMKQSAAEYLFDQRNTARTERDWLQGERDRILGEYAILQGERDRILGEYAILQGERDTLQNNLNALIASRSYRLGRMLTWFPRKMRGFFRCLKQNGLVYTIKLFVKKCVRGIRKYNIKQHSAN